MRRRSFRLKLVLLSVGLSGLVLASFAAAGWALIYRFSLERLDREIREWGHRDLERPQVPARWHQIADSVRFALGGDAEGQGRFLMLVKSRDGSTLYVSHDWPAEIPRSAFPPPTGYSAFPPPDALPPDALPPGPADAWPGDDGPPPLPPPLRDGGPGPGHRPGPPARGAEDWGGFPGPGRRLAQLPSPVRVSGPGFRTWQAGPKRWRVGAMQSPDVTLVMGVCLDEFAAGMRRVRNAFLLALPAALLMVAAGSWLLAERALRPVVELTRTVEHVTAQGLDQRVSAGAADAEFGRLVAVFNQMLSRLERSFRQAARFSADAAHELKTPLTVLQGRLEQALQHAAPDSAEQRVYGELSEEVLRLKMIVQRLLLLARADSGQLGLQPQAVGLTDLVQGLAEDVGIMAPDLTVRCDLAPDVTVQADADLIRQALHNLADNAVKYNREAGWIEFALRHDGTAARLAVTNTGPDIPAADHDRIFERFYRADPAHSRRIDGIGLGLSLAREVIRAHGGDVVLEKSAGGVTTFALTLPLAPASATLATSGNSAPNSA